MKKAVVFVDVQNDFIGGKLGSEDAAKIAPKIVSFAKKCREEGYELFATQDTHDAEYLNTPEGKKLPVAHCIEGTPGWCLYDGLLFDESGEPVVPMKNVIRKGKFGSVGLSMALMMPKMFNEMSRMFKCPKLDPKMPDEDKEYDEILICGFVTDICVISNALHLKTVLSESTKITIVEDLCAGTDRKAHEAALLVADKCQIDVKRVEEL